LSFKNIAECQGRGAHALESLPWAYKLQFTRIAGQFDKVAEGDRCLIKEVEEVVENTRKLGSDLMRIVVDGNCT
jgi:hypothetical protein